MYSYGGNLAYIDNNNPPNVEVDGKKLTVTVDVVDNSLTNVELEIYYLVEIEDKDSIISELNNNDEMV